MFSSSLSTKLYGMAQFKDGFVRAIRDVITPTLSFIYTPYFKQYYDSYIGTDHQQTYYSIFQNNIYGGGPGAKSGYANFSIINNIEMKVRSAKDTVTGMKKIVLIEDSTINESYYYLKDSVKWSPVTVSGHTRLFKDVDLQYNSEWDTI